MTTGFFVTIRPVITGNNVTHSSTSWRVALDQNFNDIVFERLKDNLNLNRILVDLPLGDEDIYYVSYKIHFNNDTMETEWSRPFIVVKNGDGFGYSNTIIATPVLSVKINPLQAPLGGFLVETSEMRIISGTGDHVATDWIITDTNENILWYNRMDKFNLTSIRVPEKILHPNRAYYIKARHVTNSNSFSNYGKLLIRTVTRTIEERLDGTIVYPPGVFHVSDLLLGSNNAGNNQLLQTGIVSYILNNLTGTCRNTCLNTVINFLVGVSQGGGNQSTPIENIIDVEGLVLQVATQNMLDQSSPYFIPLLEDILKDAIAQSLVS